MSATVAERVLTVIARETHKDCTQLRAESTLEELNVDSVDVVMILNGIEEEFGVYVPVEQGFANVKCLQDFVTLVAGLVDAQTAHA
jgi:acyl carrier protein